MARTGRPRGSPNKRTAASAIALRAAGEPDPIDRMVRVLKYWGDRSERIIQQMGGWDNAVMIADSPAKTALLECFERMQEPARIAGPYFRARHTKISGTLSVNVPELLAAMSDNDLKQLERIAVRLLPEPAGGDKAGTYTPRD